LETLALGSGMGSTHLGLPRGISSSAGVVMASSLGLAPLLGLRYTRWVFVKVGGGRERVRRNRQNDNK
jgi:hypothetical protein